MSSYDGEVVFKTKIDEDGMKRGITNLRKGLQEGFANMRDVMQGPVAAIKDLSGALKGLADSTLGQASKIEDLTAAFTPLVGGAENATAMINALNKEAASTPYELAGIAGVAKQLLPVLGNDVKKVTETFRMLGDTAGGNIEKLDSITRGYMKTMLKGKVDMESLNMIAEAGVPIYKYLADSMGVTTEKMMDMSGKGQISSAMLTKAFRDMTAEGGVYFDGMNVAALTASGKLSTMTDSLNMAGKAFGDIFLPSLKDTYDSVTNVANAFTNWATTNDNLKNTLKSLLDIMGLVAISLGTFFIVGNISAAFVILKNVIFEVRFAMLLLNEAIMKNPWGLVIAGIVAAGFALKNYADEQNKVPESFDRSTESAKKFQKQLDSMKIQGLTENETAVIENKIGSASKLTGILKGGKVIPFDKASGEDVLTWYSKVAKTTKVTAEQFSQLVLTSDKASEKLKNIAKAYLGITDASGLVTSQYEIQDTLANKNLITEEDAIKEKIKLREAEIGKLEENYKKNSGFMAGEEDQWKKHLEFIKQYNARLAELNKPKPDTPLQGTGGQIFGALTKAESEMVYGAEKTADAFKMILNPVEQLELGTRAVADTTKEISYTVTDKLVAGLSVASHLLQKMGSEDAVALAKAMNDVASIAQSLPKAIAGDPAAIASVAIAAIDLIADAWDQLWGKQARAELKAADEAAKAEADRLAAVKQIDEEYKRKSQNELQNMEDERDKAIAEARRIGANVYQIEAYYAGKIADLKLKYSGTEEEDKRKEAAKNAIISTYNTEANRLKELAKSWGLVLRDNGVVSGKATHEQAIILSGGLSKAHQIMVDGLANIENNFDKYIATYENAFEGIGSAISNGLKNGLDEAEMSDTINTMIKNLAIDAAIAATSFQTSFADIGKMIADSLSDGILDSSELSAINIQRDILTAKAMNIGDAINQVFGSGSYSSSQALNLNLDTIVTVDGQTLATATLRYTDSVLGRTYGS